MMTKKSDPNLHRRSSRMRSHNTKLLFALAALVPKETSRRPLAELSHCHRVMASDLVYTLVLDLEESHRSQLVPRSS